MLAALDSKPVRGATTLARVTVLRAPLTWVCAAGLVAALLVTPQALAAGPSRVTLRADLGVSVDADVAFTPETYSGRDSDVVVAARGTLGLVAQRDVVCHTIILRAYAGSDELASNAVETDRRILAAGAAKTYDVRIQALVESREMESLRRGQPIDLRLELDCSTVVDGEWDFELNREVVASASVEAATLGVSLSTMWLFPDDEERQVRPVTVSVTSSGTPVRIVVTRGGATVWQASSAKATYRAAIPLKRTQKSGVYRVRVTAGGDSAESTFRVSRGWAPLVDSVASWPRCSTLTWTYDGAGAPRGGDAGMIADVTAVFDRFAQLTGLRFRQEAGGRADIEIAWGKAPFDGPDASAGAAERDGVLGSGILTLFTSSDWATTAGFGVRGRGALLYHEIGHILGLGHVKDRRLLMYPIHTVGQSPLTPQPGDIAGLRELYAPTSCR